MDSPDSDERPFSPPPPSYTEGGSLFPESESGSSSRTRTSTFSLEAGQSSVVPAPPPARLSPQLEPVVLTWSPPPPPPPQIPDPHTSNYVPHTEVPPSYVPVRPVVYMFSPFSHDSMLLIPSSASSDTRPKYHISVRMNCFMPSSFITTVREGATSEGSVIGSFEMGIAASPATVTIHGREHRIRDVLKRIASATPGEWRYFRNGFNNTPRIQHLSWDCREESIQKCYSGNTKVLYATFKPLISMRVPEETVQLQTLTIMPPGQDYFDDIILSILIIERRRLTPLKSAFKDQRKLFNYG